MTPKVLFFEAPTALQVLCLWRHLRRAQRVWLQDPTFAPERFLGGRLRQEAFSRRFGFWRGDSARRGALWLMRRLNPQLDIREFPAERLLPPFYRLNHDCLPEVDRLVPRVADHPMVQLLSRIVGDDPALLRYYQAYLASIVPRWRLFLHQAQDLLSEGDELIVVPESPIEDMWHEPNAAAIAAAVPRSIDRLNRVRYAGRVIAARLGLALTSLGYVLTSLRNGIGRPAVLAHDVVMSVVWGVFGDGNRTLRGVKRFHDDMYLYGGRFQPGHIVHLFGDWPLPAEAEERFQTVMRQRGLVYADRRRFRLTGGFLRLAARTQWLALRALLPPRRWSRLDFTLTWATFKGIYHHLRAELEMENLNYRVAYVRNDYNPGHVLHTLAARRRGRRVVGAAHDATSYDAPQLAYVTFDRYLSASEMFARTFAPYWDNVNLARTGRESVDWLFEKLGTADATRARIAALYGNRVYVVTIMFPGPLARTVTRQQWREMHEGLRLLRSVELDCHIFLRFRQLQHLEHPHVAPIREIARADPRIIIDHENFTTPELQSVSDVVLTASASFAISEVLLAGKPVFTFGYSLKEDLCFPADRYGRDFVLRRADDIPRVLSRLPIGFAGLDCRWDALLGEADYHRDGRNCERIRQILTELCESVGDSATGANETKSVPIHAADPCAAPAAGSGRRS